MRTNSCIKHTCLMSSFYGQLYNSEHNSDYNFGIKGVCLGQVCYA